jgi:hypothetical protein
VECPAWWDEVLSAEVVGALGAQAELGVLVAFGAPPAAHNQVVYTLSPLGNDVPMADTTSDFYRALGRLVLSIINRDSIGNQMSALSDALQAMTARINEDFANLRALLDEALANDAADDAALAAANARADELQADIDAAITAVGAVDPDPANPAAPVEPPVEPSN